MAMGFIMVAGFTAPMDAAIIGAIMLVIMFMGMAIIGAIMPTGAAIMAAGLIGVGFSVDSEPF
jgi:hypothetical protein